MKKVLLFLINIYQKIFSILIKNMLGISSSCRYSPTCSQYAKIAITQHGIVKGSAMAAARIISCQPIDLKFIKRKSKNKRAGII